MKEKWPSLCIFFIISVLNVECLIKSASSFLKGHTILVFIILILVYVLMEQALINFVIYNIILELPLACLIFF